MSTLAPQNERSAEPETLASVDRGCGERDMKAARREFLRAVGGALAASAVSRLSWAQTWPTRSIHAVVPISAGTGIDVLARLALGELSTRLGQSIVIDNRPGASGTIGAAAVAKSDA